MLKLHSKSNIIQDFFWKSATIYFCICYNKEKEPNKMEVNDYLIDFVHVANPLKFNDIRLYQVGKMFCNDKTVIDSHTHIDWFELTVALEGKGKIYANHEWVPVSAGDIFLSFPCDIHKIVSDEKDPLKYSFLSFSTNNALLKQKLDNITQNFYECNKRVFRDATINYLMELIIAEMADSSFETQTFLSSILQEILILVIRNFLHTNTQTTSNQTSKNEILCYKIMRYIDMNVFSIRNLNELAEHFHYNYSYLAKVFRQTTQITLSQYHSNKKLEHAKLLIREGKATFTKISELLNYASLYSFSKSFKTRFGISPAEYKKKYTLL